jgi:hypothetical protein
MENKKDWNTEMHREGTEMHRVVESLCEAL